MSTKQQRLEAIVKHCEKRFNRGESNEWKHSDFVDLSAEIQNETWVSISPNTLKRIFGKISVDENYIPQQATIAALVKYGKYFESAVSQKIEPQEASKDNKSSYFFKYWRLNLIIAGIFLLVIGLMYWLNTPEQLSGKIRIMRTEGLLPATAFFDFQLPQTQDSCYIDFGDKSQPVYVQHGTNKAAHIYYIPGVFTVSIKMHGKLIASTKAYIESDKWIGFVFHRQNDIPNDFYRFSVKKTGQDSLFRITNGDIFKMGLDTTGVILTRFCNYAPIDHSGDDFVFETTFRNNYNEISNYCRSTQIQIAGSQGVIRFKFVNSGCSLRVLNILSEKSFDGAKSNLSQFVLNLKLWNSIKLINHNKEIKLFVNGKEIFTGTYQRPLGTIKGLYLEFEGTGSVKTCSLKTGKGEPLYSF